MAVSIRIFIKVVLVVLLGIPEALEWQTFHGWLEKVKDMISDEHRRLGYMAVYPIVNGSAQEALFEGTRDQCKIYTDILLENKPEMKGNIIVLEL